MLFRSISAARSGRNAKRAAFIHLYFNLIGTILFMGVFYAVHTVFPFDFMENSADAAGIAAVHSIFNIVTMLALFPFSSGLERLACLTVKDAKIQEAGGRWQDIAAVRRGKIGMKM